MKILISNPRISVGEGSVIYRKSARLIGLFLMVAVFLLSSCSENDGQTTVKTDRYKDTITIVAVIPMNNKTEYEGDYNSVMKKFKEQVAFFNTWSKIDYTLQFELHDEDAEDLDSLAKALGERSDVRTIVGPIRSTDVLTMCDILANYDKAVIAPTCTSDEVIRKFSVADAGNTIREPFLWSLCESDVSFSEMLLEQCIDMGATNLALLAVDNTYGTTFTNWIPYEAGEIGAKVTEYTYTSQSDNSDLESKAREALQSGVQCVIAVTSNVAEAKAIVKVRNSMETEAPQVLFTETAFDNDFLELGDEAEGCFGMAPYADPESGFATYFQSVEKRLPSEVEVHFYDGLLMAFKVMMAQDYMRIYNMARENGQMLSRTGEMVTAADSVEYPKISVPTANGLLKQIMVISDNTSDDKIGWSGNGLLLFEDDLAYTYLRNRPWFRRYEGAVGSIIFDAESFTCPVSSTYALWQVQNGKFNVIDYISSGESSKLSSNQASWKWTPEKRQSLTNDYVGGEYSQLKDTWAVIVVASSGWKNYRHQIDGLGMYQLLKQNGMDDDHIILIMQDDLARNPQNPQIDVLKAREDGENLYQNVTIDYITSNLKAYDIQDILLGNTSASLPITLDKTTDQSDVLLYWSGHGSEGQFKWLSSYRGFTKKMMNATLTEMAEQKHFRKCLVVAEPCYSESVVTGLEGIPGVLGIYSSKANEQSFANYYNYDMKTWMSDRFTNNLLKQISTNPGQTFSDLYENIAKNTIGSHVGVLNSKYFDNIFNATVQEFFYPVK